MRARALSVSAVAAVLVACACVWACLPDLVVHPPAAPAAAVCGDGVITRGVDGGETCDPGPDASPLALAACANCQVACDAGNLRFVDPSSGHCYFTESPGNADNAAATCEGAGAHLVRFVSEGEVSLVAANAGEIYWVGLRDNTFGGDIWLPSEATNEPGFSPQCPGCFAHVDAGSAIPTTLDAGALCVTGDVASGGFVPSWTQSLCRGVTRLGVCEREPLGSRTTACPPHACFTVAATAKHYTLVSQRLDAASAAQACKGLAGRLVVFRSREEREQVGYEIGTETVVPGAHDFWIGLSSDAQGTWRWDGDAGGLEPPPWASAETSTASSRAFVTVQPGDLSSELALVPLSAGETHYPVCEL